MKLNERFAPIRMILCDVDGVLTDGGVILDNQAVEAKEFHIRDGMGIKLWQRAGYQFGLLTGRSSHVVQVRAGELNVDLVRQGVADKLPAARDIAAELGLEANEICFIGDDLPDVSVLRWVGLAVAVADAAEEVRTAAHYTTSLAGGRGAVRETIELVLKNQGRWAHVIRTYVGG